MHSETEFIKSIRPYKNCKVYFFNSLKPQSIKFSTWLCSKRRTDCQYHQLLSRLAWAGLAATGEHLRTPASLKRELFLLTTRGRVVGVGGECILQASLWRTPLLRLVLLFLASACVGKSAAILRAPECEWSFAALMCMCLTEHVHVCESESACERVSVEMIIKFEGYDVDGDGTATRRRGVIATSKEQIFTELDYRNVKRRNPIVIG